MKRINLSVSVSAEKATFPPLRRPSLPPNHQRIGAGAGRGGGGGGSNNSSNHCNNSTGTGGGGVGRTTTANGFPPSPIPSVFLLRARPTGDVLSVLPAPSDHLAKRYSIGFVSKDDAMLVRAHVSSKSMIEFVDFSREGFSIVSIEKRVNINEMPTFLHEMDFQLFLSLPFRQLIDVGFVHQVLEDNAREILVEVQTLDAIEMNPLLFRSSALSDYDDHPYDDGLEQSY